MNDTSIEGWITRDLDSRLFLFLNEKPTKTINMWVGGGGFVRIDSKLFPEVKWEDKEPTEVEVVIKVKKNETF